MKLTTEEFIKRAKLTHGNRFDYSKVVYVKMISKVIILCPVHGETEQLPYEHLRGSGCKQCAPYGAHRRMSKEMFLAKAKLKHGNKYSYEKLNYISREHEVTITCPVHGDFQQRAGRHLESKKGCTKCGLAVRGIRNKKEK